MKTITPKKESIKKKRGEVQRLIELMNSLNLQPDDLAKITDVSERTIKNCIWNDSEIGGQLLRGIHLKLGVSVDWLLSGQGSMFPGDHDQGSDDELDSRAGRMIRFIKKWMRNSSSDEKAWLEMQFKFSVPQYQQFLLKENVNEN